MLMFQKKINGFIVFNSKLQKEDKIIIYNANKTVWKTFKLDDSFEDLEISPFAIKPENKLIVFENLGTKNGFYEVVVNQ